jgi:hypothetical protein
VGGEDVCTMEVVVGDSGVVGDGSIDGEGVEVCNGRAGGLVGVGCGMMHAREKCRN